MKALTSGVNFCTCEEINCFLEILSTDEIFKNLNSNRNSRVETLSSTVALENRVSWRAFAHAESVIVLLPTQLLYKNFNSSF